MKPAPGRLPPEAFIGRENLARHYGPAQTQCPLRAA